MIDLSDKLNETEGAQGELDAVEEWDHVAAEWKNFVTDHGEALDSENDHQMTEIIDAIDDTCLHKDVDEEIYNLTPKTVLVDNDVFIGEDSEDGYSKIKILKSILSQELVDPGTVRMTAAISLKDGWFRCNGDAKSRATYSRLFGAITEVKGTFTVTIASPAVVTLNTHGLITGDCVELTTTDALPTGLSVNVNYYVIYIDTNTFNLATTYENALAGTKIDTSGTQNGTHTLRYCPFGISGSSSFLLPDIQGVYPKGAGTTARALGKDAAGNFYSAVLGGYELDRFQAWRIAINSYENAGGVNFCRGNNDLVTNYFTPSSDGVHGTPRTGYTTEPQHVALNFIIKY